MVFSVFISSLSGSGGVNARFEVTKVTETIRAVTRYKVSGAINRLPKNQQDVLEMAYFKGYTHRQIAEALNEPLGTIKTRIRLGLQKLRQILKDENILD